MRGQAKLAEQCCQQEKQDDAATDAAAGVAQQRPDE
jgi:hypothetical protein